MKKQKVKKFEYRFSMFGQWHYSAGSNQKIAFSFIRRRPGRWVTPQGVERKTEDGSWIKIELSI